MKVYTLIVAVLAFLTTLPEAGAWDSSRRIVDCRVTPWSEWSIPEGFGTTTRERAVLSLPSNGGPPCPALKETKETSQLPSSNQTAMLLIQNFIRGREVVKNLEQPGRKKRQSLATGAVRDLLIIVDSSESIGSRNFETVKDQLGRFLGLFCPDPDPFRLDMPYHRAALLQYSTYVNEEFDFDDNTGLSEVQTSIRNMQYMNGGTCTAAAFRRARTMFSPNRGMRNDDQLNVVREVLILTDGVSSRCGGASAVQAAMDLKRDLSINATIFALAIGQLHQQGQQELLSYVSDPAPRHVFALPDFGSLASVVGEIETQLQYSFGCQPFD